MRKYLRCRNSSEYVTEYRLGGDSYCDARQESLSDALIGSLELFEIREYRVEFRAAVMLDRGSGDESMNSRISDGKASERKLSL